MGYNDVWNNITNYYNIDSVSYADDISSDPLFVGKVNGDYSLQAGSPALIASETDGEIGAYGEGGSPPPPPLPSAPTNVTATPGAGQVTISWDSVTGATSYNIYIHTASGVSKENYVEKRTDTTTSYTWTGLTNGYTYYFVVTAENYYDESADSNEVSAELSWIWTMLKLPDTGQTQSYTTTFGEDSDYNTINQPSYTNNGNGTVTDNVTGLMWQQTDDDTTRIGDDAISYCHDLTLAGYSDWRLPSKKELMSIVDYGTYNPSIDATYFPNTNASKYWSSTTYAIDSSSAWYVHFYYGSVSNYGNKTDNCYVRCVRGGQ